MQNLKTADTNTDITTKVSNPPIKKKPAKRHYPDDKIKLARFKTLKFKECQSLGVHPFKDKLKEEVSLTAWMSILYDLNNGDTKTRVDLEKHITGREDKSSTYDPNDGQNMRKLIENIFVQVNITHKSDTSQAIQSGKTNDIIDVE
jgi:hypothetical protein